MYSSIRATTRKFAFPLPMLETGICVVAFVSLIFG